MIMKLKHFVVSLLITCGTVNSAELPLDAYASRVEMRPFNSLTLTDEQFLSGDKNGPAVTLAGELRFPRESPPGKLPAVIIMHGSGGINAANQSWAYEFNQAGIASFVVDSFSGRGLTQVSTDQAKLGRFAGVLDAFKAYEVLASHPRVDANRIALIGTSRGGTAVIYTAMRRFQKTWAPNFRALVTFPLYPSCFDRLDQDEDISMPIYAFHGEIDDYASKEQCKAWLKRLDSAGKSVKSIEYKNAPHSFDSLLGSKTPVASKGSQSTSQCHIVEKSGALINTDENKPFSYGDKCVSYDPKTGYEANAANAVHKAVMDELKVLFR